MTKKDMKKRYDLIRTTLLQLKESVPGEEFLFEALTSDMKDTVKRLEAERDELKKALGE